MNGIGGWGWCRQTASARRRIARSGNTDFAIYPGIMDERGYTLIDFELPPGIWPDRDRVMRFMEYVRINFHRIVPGIPAECEPAIALNTRWALFVSPLRISPLSPNWIKSGRVPDGRAINEGAACPNKATSKPQAGRLSAVGNSPCPSGQ